LPLRRALANNGGRTDNFETKSKLIKKPLVS
jgi:hypothetical protein